ncbi:hypothetical protein [Acetobacter cerevisiae]|uniref:hypothetical protein n=1 Tax=Acetobacter cerevisiae TaxID=178900 RepID=UPI00209F7CD5|nr:hypothetical protein [Acetobacter cerevisiae]MCP1271778.1 hypothetical protein [Acetobacter cerevisiae]MCP1279724.1 hypothetical protein [Acetobacter cerevisiae]
MTMFSDITKMSTNGLKAMQKAIFDRLSEEDNFPPGQIKTYGVREFPDWKEQSDEIEAELDRRQEHYSKIPW